MALFKIAKGLERADMLNVANAEQVMQTHLNAGTEPDADAVPIAHEGWAYVTYNENNTDGNLYVDVMGPSDEYPVDGYGDPLIDVFTGEPVVIHNPGKRVKIGALADRATYDIHYQPLEKYLATAEIGQLAHITNIDFEKLEITLDWPQSANNHYTLSVNPDNENQLCFEYEARNDKGAIIYDEQTHQPIIKRQCLPENLISNIDSLYVANNRLLDFRNSIYTHITDDNQIPVNHDIYLIDKPKTIQLIRGDANEDHEASSVYLAFSAADCSHGGILTPDQMQEIAGPKIFSDWVYFGNSIFRTMIDFYKDADQYFATYFQLKESWPMYDDHPVLFHQLHGLATNTLTETDNNLTYETLNQNALLRFPRKFFAAENTQIDIAENISAMQAQIPTQFVPLLSADTVDGVWAIGTNKNNVFSFNYSSNGAVRETTVLPHFSDADSNVLYCVPTTWTTTNGTGQETHFTGYHIFYKGEEQWEFVDTFTSNDSDDSNDMAEVADQYSEYIADYAYTYNKIIFDKQAKIIAKSYNGGLRPAEIGCLNFSRNEVTNWDSNGLENKDILPAQFINASSFYSDTVYEYGFAPSYTLKGQNSLWSFGVDHWPTHVTPTGNEYGLPMLFNANETYLSEPTTCLSLYHLPVFKDDANNNDINAQYNINNNNISKYFSSIQFTPLGHIYATTFTNKAQQSCKAYLIDFTSNDYQALSSLNLNYNTYPNLAVAYDVPSVWSELVEDTAFPEYDLNRWKTAAPFYIQQYSHTKRSFTPLLGTNSQYGDWVFGSLNDSTDRLVDQDAMILYYMRRSAISAKKVRGTNAFRRSAFIFRSAGPNEVYGTLEANLLTNQITYFGQKDCLNVALPTNSLGTNFVSDTIKTSLAFFDFYNTFDNEVASATAATAFSNNYVFCPYITMKNKFDTNFDSNTSSALSIWTIGTYQERTGTNPLTDTLAFYYANGTRQRQGIYFTPGASSDIVGTIIANLNGNADTASHASTASKLAAPFQLSLTGAVTTATPINIDGSQNITITTSINSADTGLLDLISNTVETTIIDNNLGSIYLDNKKNPDVAISVSDYCDPDNASWSTAVGNINPWGADLELVWSQRGQLATGEGDTADMGLYFGSGNNVASYSGGAGWFLFLDGGVKASRVHGAVWNDYAEFRKTIDSVSAGQCVIENGDGTLSCSTQRLQPGANIVSDTFGFSIGQTKVANTPLAVSGRVLAYPHEPKEQYQPGDAVCSGPNGTVSRMTREEIKEYPDRIIGTVSEIPTYEKWGSGKVNVDGRIWIKV